jgi:sugar phosphate isomerase/epimerase
MDHFFDLLGRHILCAHARDAWLEPGLEMHIRTGGPGDGIVDYRAYLSRVRDLDPSMSLLLEHAPEERIDRYVAHVRDLCAAIGLDVEP